MSTDAKPSTMTEEQYFAAPGLSNSAMKDLAISPLRYWFLHVNPNRPPKRESPEMAFGKALHCAVLEPDEFEKRYSCEIDATDFPGCLCTMDDLRGWLRSHGLPVSGKTKDELIERVANADPSVPIYALLEQRHEADSAGKVLLSKDDWARIANAASALLSEPAIRDILADGRPEVPMFAKDPETGVLLKAKMDWVLPDRTVDVKTFVQKRGKTIDKSIHDAIFYEDYLRQAVFYSIVRGWPHEFSGEFVLAFVESEPPHEVRLKVLSPKAFRQPNYYWERTLLEVRSLIRLYADCVERFGDKPWRTTRELEPLIDEDISQLAWA